MGKKILYCASTASHILNFHLPYLKFFKEQGWQVDVATADEAEIPYVDNILNLPVKKNFFAIGNLRALYTTKKLLTKNRYDIISTHTALAGAVVRLAVMLSGKRHSRKVVHTSHGYFFNGNGRISELPYLYVERMLAMVTDVLMVMNSMDHMLAKRYKLGKEIIFIPGMGVDLSRFKGVSEGEKKKLKIAAGYNENDFLIIYAAEMNKRKNQGELIRAFALAAAWEPSLKLLLAGDGVLKKQYEKLVRKLNLENRVHFLGHVTDMVALYNMCDLAVTSSRSEGLPFNVMEAMACGLPVIASRVKGHTDLLIEVQDSFLYNSGDEKDLAERLLILYKDLKDNVVKWDRKKVAPYDLEKVRLKIIMIYLNL